MLNIKTLLAVLLVLASQTSLATTFVYDDQNANNGNGAFGD